VLVGERVSYCPRTIEETKNRDKKEKEQTSFYIRWPKALEYQDEGSVMRLFPVRELSAWSADFLFLNPKGLKEHYHYSVCAIFLSRKEKDQISPVLVQHCMPGSPF
jgi:hypothetical protein